MSLNEQTKSFSPTDTSLDAFKTENEKPDIGQNRSKYFEKIARLIILGAVILGAAFWFSQRIDEKNTSARLNDIKKPELLRVESTILARHLTILGNIGANNSSIMFAPFDGTVNSVFASVGESVKAGDILAIIDTTDFATEYRTAEANFIKARNVVQSLRGWRTSADYQSALRALQLAETELLNLQKETDILADLFDRGIVPRNEYEVSLRQIERHVLNMKGQRQELKKLEEASQGENFYLAELELKSSKERFERLEAQKENAVVKASKDGILVSLPSNIDSDRKTTVIKTGSQLKKGQPIFAIADARVFLAEGQIDENDINRVHIGQAVEITSEAFPKYKFKGEVSRLSSEASASGSGRQRPTFQIQARFKLGSDTPSQIVRLGMSSRMKIETYYNADAIIVPIEAIENDGKNSFVYVQRNEVSSIEQQKVELGPTTIHGVEVATGLETGDLLVIRQR